MLETKESFNNIIEHLDDLKNKKELSEKAIQNLAYPKKSWKDKYWLPIAIFTYVLGLFTPTIQKSIEQKIYSEPIKPKQESPIYLDSLKKK